MYQSITPKDGSSIQKLANELRIVLENPGVVTLGVGPEAVASYQRVDNDLVLVLADGRQLIIVNFFVMDEDGNRNDLVFVDDHNVTWWAQYTGPWQAFDITEITQPGFLAPVYGANGWVAAALLGGGGLAALAGGGGDKSAPPVPPVITLKADKPGLQLDEAGLENGPVQDEIDLSDLFNIDPRTGGLRDVTYELLVGPEPTGLIDVETGEPVVLVKRPDGSVEGVIVDPATSEEEVVLQIVIDPDTGEATVDLLRPVTHPDEGTDPLTLDPGALLVEVTVTNGSGLTSSQTADAGSLITITDDIPTVAETDPEADPVTLTEANLSGGSEETPTALQVTGELGIEPGADGFGSTSLINIEALKALNLTSHDDIIDYSLSDDETLLIATALGRPVFTLDLTDPNSFQFTLEGPIDHPDDGGANSDIRLTFEFRTEDADGDSATGSFVITIEDDVPTVTPVDPDAEIPSLSEANLPGGSDADDEALTLTGELGIAPGADGFGATSLVDIEVWKRAA